MQFAVERAVIYSAVKPLVLGSNSPRRKEFLEQLGLVFTVYGPEIDESVTPGESPAAYVERMAAEKVKKVMGIYPDHYIIGADTSVCLGDRILGKPESAREAVQMLMDLSGRDHVVCSGISIGCHREQVQAVLSVSTSVVFAPFDESVARAYVASGESLDKAGGYGIQGKGTFMVERINGSYSNVVGLPLMETVSLLTSHGVIAVNDTDGP
ncbi:nucleoside triphosphate pyrophosphatase [Desulfopila sp. IMCC35008]|uniref:Maf family protein n=1 Tax=Desulfopila sp. IMCC35008 TaxID=2653858 RepID=UPI0013D109E5|nr:nucleoside triphosphate pyrophosphatase [Desulfopila sp. IMCC35008]